MNNITQILDIKDSGIKVLAVKETTATRTVTIEKEITFHFCPVCGCRMYSKGIYTRHVNHPIMQDGLRLILEIKQRRWRCSNNACGYTETDEFSFVDKNRRNTNLSDILIVEAFRNPENSAAQIARMHNVSDTHAIRTFARYVNLNRRQLPEAICIDEVFLNVHHGYKYALVIQDFLTGESIDLVETRRKIKTESYFLSIPLKERQRVKYVISDMYKQYLEYTRLYFPNAVSVIDAFHVIQTINFEFLKYIRKLIRSIDEKDHIEHQRREDEFHRELDFKHSKDYFLLKKYHGMLLKNGRDLKIYTQPKFNKFLGRMMTTYDYFEWMFKIDPKLEHLRDLKEVYILFNSKYAGDPKGAAKALPQVIARYRSCEYEMYHKVADMLEENFEAVINSFIMLEKHTGDKVRLSNGPIEGLNRITKDMKRIARGFRNFEFIRQRFLFATRKNAQILGSPRKLEETYLKAYIPEANDNFDTFYDEDIEDDWVAMDEDNY